MDDFATAGVDVKRLNRFEVAVDPEFEDFQRQTITYLDDPSR